jgi:hypothetical protein
LDIRDSIFLFPEAEMSLLRIIEKIWQNHTFFGIQSRGTIFIDTINIGSKEVRMCGSELLLCHKYFIALSPIIKLAKCSKSENFSLGTNSIRFIILPQRDGIEPFL